MRLIIIDDVSVQDIADILGTRGTEKTEEPKECTQIKVGERVQVDDPNTGYHTGAIDEIKDGSVHLSGVGWFSGDFVTGKLS